MLARIQYVNGEPCGETSSGTSAVKPGPSEGLDKPQVKTPPKRTTGTYEVHMCSYHQWCNKCAPFLKSYHKCCVTNKHVYIFTNIYTLQQPCD